jgi:hypothetical protein
LQSVWVNRLAVTSTIWFDYRQGRGEFFSSASGLDRRRPSFYIAIIVGHFPVTEIAEAESRAEVTNVWMSTSDSRVSLREMFLGRGTVLHLPVAKCCTTQGYFGIEVSVSHSPLNIK